jgi:ribonuclease VapC
MIAVDTSAIVAILKAEPNEPELRAKLNAAKGALISAGSVLELQLVLGGEREIAAWSFAEAFFRKYGIVIRSFDERQLNIAREAAIRFGKGRHKARLNFGDCFAYALAKSEDIPLLCTGSDFAETDVAVA